jgi:hypothetical protein
LQVLPSPPMHLLSFALLLPLALAGHFGRHRRRGRWPQFLAKAKSADKISSWHVHKDFQFQPPILLRTKNITNIQLPSRMLLHYRMENCIPTFDAEARMPYSRRPLVLPAQWIREKIALTPILGMVYYIDCIGGLGAWSSSDLPINQALSSG